MQLSLRALVAAAGCAVSAHGAEPAPVVVRAAAESSLYADTNDVVVVTPVTSLEIRHPLSAWSVEGRYLVDVVSAASVDIVSTASPRWEEVRHEVSLEGQYKPDRIGVRARAATSHEPDYSSFAGGGTALVELGENRHVLFAGYTRGHDTIGRTGTPFDVFSRTLERDTAGAGVTLTLGSATVFSGLVEATFERGDQSKPYRYVPLFAADAAAAIEKGESLDVVNARRLPERPIERLPGARQRYAVTARFGHRFPRGTLRLEERLYADSWELRASTTEARYFADVSRRFTLWPRIRFHAQSGASFWRRAYVGVPSQGGVVRVPEHRAGDHELGPLLTFGGGLGASFGLGREQAPAALRVFGQFDGSQTHFLNDLFLTSRTSTLLMLGVEGELR